MEIVTVSKTELRKTLEKNKKTHEADFELAWEAFKERAIQNFEERLKQLKDLKKGQQINLWVNLEVPENHSDDYERALQMLDWEVGDEVELTQYEFQQLVQDDWSWKVKFSTTNTFYTGSTSPSSIPEPKIPKSAAKKRKGKK